MTCSRLAILLVAAIATAAAPRPLHGQRTGVEIWAAVCGGCHVIQPASRYSAKDWDAIGTHMIITARLTGTQSAAVLEFLKANAKRSEDCCKDGESPNFDRLSLVPRVGEALLTAEQAAAVARYLLQRQSMR